MKNAFIIAGEPSGDKLAQSLMRAMQSEVSSWHGLGGPLMAKEGLVSAYNYELLHIIGFWDALRHYRAIKRLMRQLVKDACAKRPDIIFTIDSKAFSLRFAKEMKKEMAKQGWHAPIIHMVAPTVWAYGAKRARAFEAAFDGLLCLFPMEPALFDASQCACRFIGHPSAYQITPKSRVLEKGQPLTLALLPGSRKGEVQKLLPSFARIARKLADKSSCHIRIPTLPALQSLVKEILNGADISADVSSEPDALKSAFDDAHYMIAASGTVTLEAALSAMPGLVAYRLNPLVTEIMRWRFKTADPVLPNIISGKRIYPFYLNREIRPDLMFEDMHAALVNYEAVQGAIYEHALGLKAMLQADAPDFETAIARALQDLGVKKGSE